MRPSGEKSISFSLTRFTRKLVLFTYGYFLLFLFRDDMIKHYIHERYQVITVTGSVLLIAASVIYSSTEKKGDGHHGHKPSPLKALAFPLVSLFVLAPVVWGFISPPEILGASKDRMNNRFSFSSHSSSLDPEAIRRPGPRDRTLEFPSADGTGIDNRIYTPINVMELNYLLSGAGDSYTGDRIAVQGFVYHEPDNESDEFTLVRYQVPCCIVHAHPVSIFVQSAQSAELHTEQWVVVYGTIRKMDPEHARHHAEHGEEHEGEHEKEGEHECEEHVHLPFLIEAEKIELEKTPQDPYINKWFVRKPFKF